MIKCRVGVGLKIVMKDYYQNNTQADVHSIFFFRNRKVRVLIIGDYESLCTIYDITGANGKNNVM